MSASDRAPTLKDFVRVVPIGENVFESVYCCEKMGNVSDIGYGGCLISLCVSAAFAAIPQDTADRIYDIYSVLGTFLGPTSIKSKLTFTVEDVRTTKSFATRKVEAWQELPSPEGAKSSKRRTMILLADFHVRERPEVTLSGMDYSIPPLAADSLSRSPDTLQNQRAQMAAMHPSRILKVFDHVFPLFDRYLDLRPVEDSMGTQKALGLNSSNKTTQDHLPLQQRTNSHWFRIKDVEGGKGKLQTRSENAAAVAFVMDSALAFLPLTFTHRFFDAVQAVSTLEFSLRFFDVPNVNDWVLHEQHTENGGAGRTFSTGRLWNREGKCVASMSQQSIMRARAQKENAKL
ncbi:hypothetical protein NliqN6_0609 [Naganishia liquefaciens]|uniref:Acyl-CoA thioesterase II n=1 Tax=Naganishia liquefaciens TaxID=104408 RepID=A0A8H3YDE0_9TREE|nr:hypothetical protein NliqN6_0609 [Naganishia liquefaciens]